MGYIAEEIAEDHQKVRGVIIALGDDLRIKWALRVAVNIDSYRYEVKFDLKKS
jgi:restriction system protein